MDPQVPQVPQVPVPVSVPLDGKMLVIVVLSICLVVSVLGINSEIQIFFQQISQYIGRFISNTSYYSGTLLNQSADIVATTAKDGVDIADGAVKDIGNLLVGDPPNQQPQPDDNTSQIQTPISSQKYNWCLVGEYQNRRGCVPVTESETCLSGQLFPTQRMCLNPNLSTY